MVFDTFSRDVSKLDSPGQRFLQITPKRNIFRFYFFLSFLFSSFRFNHGTWNLTPLVCVLPFFYVSCKATKHRRRSGTYKNLNETHVLFCSVNSFPAAETRFGRNVRHTFQGVIRKKTKPRLKIAFTRQMLQKVRIFLVRVTLECSVNSGLKNPQFNRSIMLFL